MPSIRVPALALPLLLSAGLLDAAEGPLHDWDLNEPAWRGVETVDRAGRLRARMEGELAFTDDGALWLKGGQAIVAAGVNPAGLPKTAITAEATVAIDKGQRWGSIVAFAQDNGNYERGWLLGYNEGAFLFWVSTGGGLIQATSESMFEPGRFYHVAGSFDGEHVRIHVDGELEGEVAAAGEIAYPKAASYAIGVYKDDDEFYPMVGKLQTVRIFREALTGREIAGRAGGGVAPVDFAVRPALQFISPTSARVTWESVAPGGAAVAFGKTRRLGTVARSEKLAGLHTVVLDGLEPGTVYYYKIGLVTAEGGARQFSRAYEFNTALNFTPPAIAGEPDADAAKRAADILSRTGVRKGFCVVLGAGDGKLLIELARASDLTVVAAEADKEVADAARSLLYRSGAHGSRVTVLDIPDPDGALPLTSNMVNLLVSNRRAEDDEIKRLLVPGRGRAVFLAEGGRSFVKPPQQGAGEWTHQYGDAGNSASSSETLAGATKTGDFALQWVGRPGADFGIDRNPRMPAPISAGGRLFHQGMDRLVALDAHNGAVLWGLEAPDLRRLNIPRDCGNWCADGKQLFVAIKERAWVFDAARGERLETLTVLPKENAAAGFDWGYIARSGDILVGSSVRANTGYTSFWSKEMWYDGKAGSTSTGQVCSDNLFAYSTKSAEAAPAWVYQEGVILNPTIAMHGGRVYFVECRNPDIKRSAKRKIREPELWQDQHLVALDAESGKTLWERPIDTEDGTITFYLQASSEAVLITASNSQFHLYAFDPGSGEPMWSRSNPWPDDHHSGHFQHPVITGDTIYLQPNGYKLKTGEVVTTKVGRREGCHTYVGAGGALIYRGQSRQVAMWDRTAETVSSWPRLRPSCWLSTIPAAGMLLLPEGGGGCSCGGWMETSVGFMPRVHLRR